MQEDKELTFDAIDTVKGCISLFNGMMNTMTFNKPQMEKSAKHGFTNATDAADYLVNHGVPFRDAHGIVGQLVLLCLDKHISLDELPLDEYQKISPAFEEDIYDAISMILLPVLNPSSMDTNLYSLEFQMITSSLKRLKCIMIVDRADKSSIT